MVKWMRFFVLVGAVAVVGCSKGGPVATKGVVSNAEAKVDAAQEKAASNSSFVQGSSMVGIRMPFSSNTDLRA